MVNLKQDLKIKQHAKNNVAHKVTKWTDHDGYDTVCSL